MKYNFTINAINEASEDFGLTLCAFDKNADVKQIAFNDLTNSETYDEQRKQLAECKNFFQVDVAEFIEDFADAAEQLYTQSKSDNVIYTVVSDIDYLT